MQFNRYTFFSNRTNNDSNIDIGEVDKSKNFTSVIKSCGFVQADGSEIDPSTPVTNFKWKYDKDENAACWGRQTYPSGGYYYQFAFYSRGLNYSSINHLFYNYDYSPGAYSPWCQSFFFIPLKNNGFIIEAYPLMLWYGYYNSNPKLMSVTDHNNVPLHAIYEATQRSFMSTGLGFYNNVTNNYWYIISNAVHGYWAYRGGEENDPGESARSATLYNQGTSMSVLNDYRDIYRNKTDYKQNICTLIKAPCGDGFLSNLYIVSTSPAPERRYYYSAGYDSGYHNWIGTDNRFFSFNGRNFYGFMNNLAVELPSD
ncbi:MAG: hypothetical protein J6T10_29400 [Methanobrevibacter sp.]|nr:hypothetical protein [Methanobrevibacter sp.]